jgi:hypothetical protein
MIRLAMLFLGTVSALSFALSPAEKAVFAKKGSVVLCVVANSKNVVLNADKLNGSLAMVEGEITVSPPSVATYGGNFGDYLMCVTVTKKVE